MFKKLSVSVFVLALLAGAFAPAQAQDTVGIYIENPGTGFARYGSTTQGVPFNIAVFTDTLQPSCAAEFVITELRVLFPGVFALSTTKVNNTPLDLGNNAVGEYVMAYAGCVAPGPREIVRIQYGDFGGIIGADVVLKIRGLQPGDSVGSTFAGQMGYVDSSDQNHVLNPEPWVDWDVIDPTKDLNTSSADGVCVLNADALPSNAESVSALKARF